MPDHPAPYKVDDRVERRTGQPWCIGVVVFAGSKRPGGPQQIVIDSPAHDKFQVGWASDFIPWKIT